MKVCTIDGCERKCVARGYCSAHHKRWKRYGDPTYVHPLRTKRTCQLQDCDKAHLAQGYCSLHYNRWSRYGDPHALVNSRQGVLPIAPLITYITLQDGLYAVLAAAGIHRTSGAYDRESALIERAAKVGYIDVDMADRFCCRILGVHPSFVYGDSWFIEELLKGEAA